MEIQRIRSEDKAGRQTVFVIFDCDEWKSKDGRESLLKYIQLKSAKYF